MYKSIAPYVCFKIPAINFFSIYLSAHVEVLKYQISLLQTACFQPSLLSQLERKKMKEITFLTC